MASRTQGSGCHQLSRLKIWAMSALTGIFAAFGELASREDSAAFYRIVVMVMDILVLGALVGLEVLRKRKKMGILPFVSFHLFSLPMMALTIYGYLLYRSDRVGAGKEAALLHVIILLWLLVVCLWEWSKDLQMEETP